MKAGISVCFAQCYSPVSGRKEALMNIYTNEMTETEIFCRRLKSIVWSSINDFKWLKQVLPSRKKK